MAITGKFVSDFSDFNRGVTEAGAKLRTFEGETTKAGTSIKTMETSAKSATGILGGMGAQLAAMFTVGAIVSFGRSVLQAGDAIQKMADQTGLSTAEVQKLQYVAGQSGTAIGSLVSAVQNLQQRLGDDSSGAAGAMAKLGINAEAFNKLGTYQQMITLADAVRGVKDPTEQASVAAALFGKTWKEILPAIKSGMESVGNQAPIMADATVKSLDRIGDSLKRSQQIATAWGGGVVLAIEGAGFALGDYLSKFSPTHFGIANSQLLAHETALAKLEGRVVQGKPPVLALGEAATGMGMSFEDASKTAARMDREILASIQTNTKAAAAVQAQTDALTRQYPAIDRLKGSYDDLDAKIAAMTEQLNDASASNTIFDSGLKFTAETIETVVGPAIESMGEQVRLLSGELVSLAKAQEMRAAGGTSAMGELSAADFTAAGGKNRISMLENSLSSRSNYGPTYEGMLAFMADQVLLAQLKNFVASMPKMAAGGPVLQDGPIYAHKGEYVVPKGGGGAVTNHFYVNGTAEDVARKIAAILQRSIMQGQKIGAA